MSPSLKLMRAIFGVGLEESDLRIGIHEVLVRAINSLKHSAYTFANSQELDKRLHLILLWRYGFETPYLNFFPTRDNIAKEVSIGRERVRQIETVSLRKLRHPSRSRKFREYLK